MCASYASTLSVLAISLVVVTNLDLSLGLQRLVAFTGGCGTRNVIGKVGVNPRCITVLLYLYPASLP